MNSQITTTQTKKKEYCLPSEAPMCPFQIVILNVPQKDNKYVDFVTVIPVFLYSFF